MGLIRFIFWSIIFYTILKLFKAITRIFKSVQYNNDNDEPETIYHNEHKTKINEKDIIEADYEDLTPPNHN